MLSPIGVAALSLTALLDAPPSGALTRVRLAVRA